MLAITSRTASDEDVRHIFDDLAERTKIEIQAVGLVPDTVRAWRAEFGADSITVNEEPVALLGSYPENGVRYTWLLGREAFFQPCVVRFSRRYIVSLRQQYPGVQILSLSRSQHPRTERWFKLLGFRKIHETMEPNGLIFRVFEVV
ncbi:hypothetical protein [Labrys sp. 22185]|uniref:hypothetical protein n=1 Tax=Labrys sp. 22185 TaxID=3453888 RepID=UPI003F8569C0